MAVSAETQRLISVSLGKIAQSRGQRGGINLHKNLLVATVLHKARTAYMMESYNYQQNLHRQKLLEQYQLQQQQHHQQQHLLSLGQRVDSSPLGESNKGDVGPLTRDSNLGHATSTPKPGEQTRSEVSSFSGPSLVCHEHVPVQDCKVETVRDKENSPPVVENHSVLTENVSVVTTHLPSPQESHLVAATQLSQEVQMAASEQQFVHKQSASSGGATCSVLKRRRDKNQPTSLHDECSLNKMAKLSYDNHSTQNSDYSSDSCSHESYSQSEVPHPSEHHQISNLVSIFNSGFSGLCVTPSSELHTTGYQTDFIDISISLTRNISVKAG